MTRVRSPHPAPLAKRLLDVTFSSLAIALLSPLMLILSLGIRLDSRGPIIFRSRRIGRNGRPFTMLKFRTMRPDAEELLATLKARNLAGERFIRIPNDPRVTGFGRLLRKLSLDELPQLFNVLRGEMSLVGPRPQSPSEVALYSEREARRLDVPPGITGLWQVTARKSVDFEDWVRLDLFYIDNRTFWLDLKILFLTVPAMLRGTETADHNNGPSRLRN